MFPIGGKYLSPNAVHNWVEKRGKRFADDEEFKTEVRKWLRQQSENFYATSFDAQVKRWASVSMLLEDMPRNNFFPSSNITCFVFHINLLPIYLLSLLKWSYFLMITCLHHCLMMASLRRFLDADILVFYVEAVGNYRRSRELINC
jgi:hypothetical protein